MRFVWITLAVLAVAVPATAWGLFEYLLTPPGPSKRQALVVVKPGAGVAAIAKQLESQRLVRSDVAFTAWLRLMDYDRAIKAGVYAINPSMGARGIAEILVEGKGQTKRVTVPEGFSLRQIAALLEADTPGSGERFTALTKQPASFAAEFEWLKTLPDEATLEGFLFPDTYVVTPEPGAEKDLIRLMLARFEQVVLPVYQAATKPQGMDLLKTVTMASIVEKEARHANERPTIAGVFFNRLAQGMPFGSDPTVEYALNKHQGAKGLSFKDIAVASPYNTYVHAGLPPGPIASPGLASIEASLKPEATPFMYFVARGDGTHAFTRTYADHLATQRRIIAGQ